MGSECGYLQLSQIKYDRDRDRFFGKLRFLFWSVYLAWKCFQFEYL